MELLLHSRHGISLVLAPVPQPALRVPTLEAAVVDIFLGYADDEFGQAKFVGSVTPGGTLTIEHNPDRDRDLRLYKISRALNGTPEVGQMLDAESILLPINRMVDTPTLVQPVDATNTVMFLGVPTNRYVRTIKVEVSPHPDMSGSTTAEVAAGNDNQVTLLQINRGTGGSGTQTRYVRVSFSAGNGYGPTSPIKTMTFANIGGTGGSTGAGSLPPGALVPVTVS